MFEEYQICPYTGLRSFTEEESLYFKGREEHIEQATEQLQRNKFLMLTGASGDGKSSLVYAGIVPNARAGFLKSKYTQWSVADFRPERSPFKNLCRSLAKQLDIANAGIVESELQHGFSALVDLYKNSKCFIDVDSIAWQQADDSQQAALKRKASNLMIIVDQFEEFFTNPENYHHGIPSRDSNLVLNVLLETSRIALEENLPIYIVFTMRSDYIGQCAAFRGLPEYIGFSQFFVPRLNRSQLQQVIEEPAVLSGNRISRRLTERLIHDISEGVDQLPILQHALNQIWHAADQGKEEMDLIHYAMVGGIGVNELPDEQVERYKTWYDGLSTVIKSCYHKPDLQNVLDTHTNKLYEQAADYYFQHMGKAIADEDAKAIIKVAFICLTKIDQSRAVRNRMTLGEITHILGRPEFGSREVGAVLNIFREPGNTFIRPFIQEDDESKRLSDDDVLDITHESLIRNWEYLETWANEEFHDYTISLDFEQQLKRWVESGKSNGFLLSIGALTYFENWYNKVKPNAYWIARYLPEEIDQKDKLNKAAEVLENAHDFLERSRRKHAVTRTVMRYGPKRIAAVLGLMAILVLSSFAVRDYFKRQNTYVLNQLKERTLQIANSRKADFYSKSILFAEQIRAGELTVDELINGVADTLQKVNVASRLAGMLTFQGRREPEREIAKTLEVSIDLLSKYDFKNRDVKILEQLLKETNYIRATVGAASIYNSSPVLKQLSIRNAGYAAALVKYILQRQPAGFTNINHLNAALENALNHRSFHKEDLEWLAATLSPFENRERPAWVLQNYHRDNLMIRGHFDYGYKYNGLFQELAYVYAALGHEEKALACVDTLLYYRQTYYQNDYGAMPDNASNIAITFFLNGHGDKMNSFLEGYAVRKQTTIAEVHQRLQGRCMNYDNVGSNLNENVGLLTNLNGQFSDSSQVAFIFDAFRKSVNKHVKDKDERNFLTALSYKDEAIFQVHLMRQANRTVQREFYVNLFDKAFEFYHQVSPDYLSRPVSTAITTDNDARMLPIKYIFLHPDYRSAFAPLEPRRFYYWYTSACFIDYILSKDLLMKEYTGTDLLLINNWIEAHEITTGSNSWNGAFVLRTKENSEIFRRLATALEKTNAPGSLDLNRLYFRIGLDATEENDTVTARMAFAKLNKDKIGNLLRNTDQNINRDALYVIARTIQALLNSGNPEDAYSLIRLFKNPINRSSLYGFVSSQLLLNNQQDPLGKQLLDSSRAEMLRLTNLTTGQPNRQLVSYALILENPKENEAEAYRVIKNIFDKTSPIQRVCRTYARYGQLYDAQVHQLPNLSDNDEAMFLWNIVYGYHSKDTVQSPWREYERNHNSNLTRFLPYVNDDN